MTHQELLSSLQSWTDEFQSLLGHVSIPDSYLPFLAKRLVDAGVCREDPDVVRIKLPSGKVSRCRITSLHESGRMLYSSVEPGQYGSGLCVPDDVLPEDKPKLAELLDRLDT